MLKPVKLLEPVLKAQQKALTKLCGKVCDSESSEENGGNSEIELEYGDEEAIVSLVMLRFSVSYVWASIIGLPS